MLKELVRRPAFMAAAVVIIVFLAAGGFLLLTLSETFSETKGLPCGQLPDLALADSTLLEHRDIRAEVEKYTSWPIQIDSVRCPGKADLLIYYNTVSERGRIKALIGDSFFGIPYRMFNV